MDLTEEIDLSKKVALDFDGVIHKYTSGWQGPHIATDGIVDGAKEFIQTLQSHGYEVVVFSCRASYISGHEAIERFLEQHGIQDVIVTSEKPPAGIYIDDRGFCFEGDFPSLEYIENFKTWTEQ